MCLVCYSCGLYVERPIGPGAEPEAGAWSIGFEGITVPFVESTFARLRYPVRDGDTEWEFDKAVLGGGGGEVGGEVRAILGDVIARESIAGGEASRHGLKVLAEDKDALADVGADEVEGHSGGGV